MQKKNTKIFKLNNTDGPKKDNKSKKLNKGKKIALVILLVLFVAVSGIIIGAFANNSDKLLEEEATQDTELISQVNYVGGFPVAYNSSDIIDIKSFSSEIFVISKRLLTCFTSKGKISFVYNFSFKEPIVETSDKYGVVFDRGASEFIIFNHKGVLAKGKAENSILCAQINNNGDVVFAVKGNSTATEVYHYDKTGEKIFGWSCANEYVVSVDLNNDADYFTAGAIGVENGSIYSVIYAVDKKENETLKQYRLDGKSVVSVNLTGNDLSALCSDSRFVFDLKDVKFEPQIMEFDQEITLFDTDSNGNCAVLSESFSASGDNKITIYNKKNEIVYVGLTKEKAREILCFGKKAYMLTKDGVFISVNDGTFKKMTEDTIDGDHMFICKKKLYFYSDDIIDICK